MEWIPTEHDDIGAVLVAQGESVAFCVALRTLGYKGDLEKSYRSVHLHGHADKGYQALMLLRMNCAERSASQANNDVIHQHWDFFAHEVSSTPIVRSEIREDFDLERG